MRMSEGAKNALTKHFEGLVLHAYPDPANKYGIPWTIGYGHTRGVKEGDVCTEEEANTFLDEDLTVAETTINRYVPTKLTQHQFDAVCDFIFNIGEPKFLQSTLYSMLKRGDFEGAALQFNRWKFAGGKISNGIIRRRAAETAWFLKEDEDGSD